jgi:hypothetical protein
VLADWAELHLASTSSTGVTARTIERLLRGEATDAAEVELEAEAEDDDEPEGAELEVKDSPEGGAERDFRVEQLFEEVDLRLRIGPIVYPFETLDEQIIEREADGRNVYLFLLILSSTDASYRAERRAHEVEAAFDIVALTALRKFFGGTALGVRFARNSHDPEEAETRPALFSEAITWLRERLDLARGVAAVDEYDEDPSPHWESTDEDQGDGHPPLNTYKDAGVDVVVWRQFADNRKGFPVMLAQCTVQIDWGNKTSDIKLDLWMKWIDFDTVPPQRALVIPFAVNRDDPLWGNRTVEAGVIFDRLRLLEMLNELSAEELPAILDSETNEWVARELASLV